MNKIQKIAHRTLTFIDSQMEHTVMPTETRVKLEAMIKKYMDYIDGGNDEETN